MRQLKLEYGILIGQGIQIFYDGILSNQEDPILLETIKFEKNNEKGIKFTQLFDKEYYNKNSLIEFTKESLKKIDRKKDFKTLSDKIESSNFIENLNQLIKQEFISDYDGELIDSVLNNLKIDIRNKNLLTSTPQNKIYQPPTYPTNKKLGVIESIKNTLTNVPKSQGEILEHLILLFPERVPESMKKTVQAQLGGRTQPVRIEREKNFELIISVGVDNVKRYSIDKGNVSLTNNGEKIGQFVQEKFRELFNQTLLTKGEVNNLQNKDYSKRIFNQNYEVLRNRNREIKDNLGRNRYYSKEIFCGDYYLTSQWVETHREPFRKWLSSIINKK